MQIEDCINFLLTGAQHKVFQMMKKALDPFDLTPIQYGVLACVWQKDIRNPKEVAEFLSIENSTISGILERMESKDLLIREIDPNDRRYIRIVLTEKSERLEKPVLKTVAEVNKEILKSFSERDEDKLRALLKAVIALP